MQQQSCVDKTYFNHIYLNLPKIWVSEKSYINIGYIALKNTILDKYRFYEIYFVQIRPCLKLYTILYNIII